MAKSTLSALNALADQVPGLNQRALQQVQAARDIGLQQQVQAAPRRGATAPTAQTLATRQALQAGQDIVAQRQAASAQAGQIRQAALQERARVGQADLQQRQQAQQERLEAERRQQLNQLRKEERDSRKTVLESDIASAARLQGLGIDQDNRLQIATLKQREDLANLGTGIKQELVDSRLQFERDERGRKFSNQRQLVDYTAATARDRQEFNRRMSSMVQAQKMEMEILKHTQSQLEAALQRGYLEEKGDLDFEQQKELATLNAEMRKKIAEEQADAANQQAIFTAAGTVLGAAAGAVLGGPAGAAIGGSLGGATGSLIGGLV